MKYSIEYCHELEILLQQATRQVAELSKPYDVEINDREEEIRSLKQLQSLLSGIEQPVNIKIKTKTLGKRKWLYSD